MDLLKNVTIHTGDALAVLRKLPAESVHTVVTSPPYWALRDYGVEGQYGLEDSPAAYLRNMVRVFSAVRRVLRKDGTCWVNMGDSYAGSRSGPEGDRSTLEGTRHNQKQSRQAKERMTASRRRDDAPIPRSDRRVRNLKPKDLVGMPWRLALAMQADGWWLRRDIIWAKANPMPETVKDRCTTAHEYFFHFSKSERYYYNASAIAEPTSNNTNARQARAMEGQKSNPDNRRNSIRPPSMARSEGTFPDYTLGRVDTRNKRSVWHVQTEPYAGAHFATFGPTWIEPAILAGCPPGGIVLDPFGGSGTTAGVAIAHDRRAILIELNPASVLLMPDRIESVVRKLRNAPAPLPVSTAQVSLFDLIPA